MSHGDGTKGAGDLDEGVLVGDAELCGMERNVSGAGGNCGNEVETAEVGRIGARAGPGVDGSWRRRWVRCVDAGLVDFGVFGAGIACLRFCTVGNVFTMRGNCLSARGDAIVGIRGKKTLRGVKRSGADCWTWGSCAGAAEVASMNKGPSCSGGNIAAASGGVWNDGDASEDEAEGGKTLHGVELSGAEEVNRRVCNAASKTSSNLYGSSGKWSGNLALSRE